MGTTEQKAEEQGLLDKASQVYDEMYTVHQFKENY